MSIKRMADSFGQDNPERWGKMLSHEMDSRTEELSDEPEPPAEDKSWGFHLLVDMSDCNDNIDDEEAIATFFGDLIDTLDMKPLTPLILKRVDSDEEGRGVSAMQMITTSSITFHGDDEGMCGYLDVFTCKFIEDFQGKVLSLIEKTFEPEDIGHKLIYRDAGHNAGSASKSGAD